VAAGFSAYAVASEQDYDDDDDDDDSNDDNNSVGERQSCDI
jgi:hypothetical protein